MKDPNKQLTFEELKNLQEIYRKKYRHTSIISYPITIVLSLAITTIILIISSSFNPFVLIFALLFAIIVAVIIVVISTHKQFEDFKSAYKTYFVYGGLTKIFTDVSFNHEQGLPKETVKQVLNTADRYSSNDLVTASYKNVNFTQADVHIEERYQTTSSNGTTTTAYTDLFKGRFLIFDFNRNFSFALQVNTKWFQGAVRPATTQKLSFKKIETESIEFNKHFKVYGQDGVDTFYILDPAFIEKIENLQKTCNCGLSLTFLDKKLYIALNNKKDSFELAKPRKPLDEKVELEKVNRDINVITNFVDTLNLDKYFIKKGAT